jgi:hypothetical protein
MELNVAMWFELVETLGSVAIRLSDGECHLSR